jgi:hypothetical protein
MREYALESVRRHYGDFGQPWLWNLYGNGMESLATTNRCQFSVSMKHWNAKKSSACERR